MAINYFDTIPSPAPAYFSIIVGRNTEFMVSFIVLNGSSRKSYKIHEPHTHTHTLPHASRYLNGLYMVLHLLQYSKLHRCSGKGCIHVRQTTTTKNGAETECALNMRIILRIATRSPVYLCLNRSAVQVLKSILSR